MKYLTLIIICLLTIACSVETEIEIAPTVDFAGTYFSKINCVGELSEDNGEDIVIVISKTTGNNLYNIDLGDEVIFQGIQNNTVLVIEEQTLNEELEFDVITLAGELQMGIDDQVVFSFDHEVDEEGMSSCTMTLVKQ